MLLELSVEDLGIVDGLRLTFGPGMTAITGETGAGKTLIVSALSLLVGGRADPLLVRDGAAEARVAGRFLLGDDEVVLERVVPADGRSRAYRDGRMVTAQQLAEVGRLLVDLHGQHAHQSLLAADEQRRTLDRYAGAPAQDALARVREARAALARIDRELALLGGDPRARAREVDLLTFQRQEIDDAAIADPDEDARLADEEELLAEADAHREALGLAHAVLEGPAADALGEAVAHLAGRGPFADLAARVRDLQAQAADAAVDVRHALEQVVVDPERLAEVRARRARLRELCRKYGDTLADVLAYRDEVQARLAELDAHESTVARLTAERAAALDAAQAAAAALSAARRAAAVPFAQEVAAHLHTLAMPAASLVVDVAAAPLGDDGADTVTFLLAPNPGEPARPLAKAASGGELARAMLAVRVVLSEAPPTLVFDEVDAGIGGEAGTAVGRALASLASRHQVFVVTHLAQVAAHADAHVVVTKAEVGGRTVASAERVEGAARVEELSRMLSGAPDSAHARRHAAELLDAAARAGA